MGGDIDPLRSRLPVTLVTGFLGSGKTTLIGRLLRHPSMRRVAVIINEAGEIGIDHDIVAMSSEQVSLLANGCLCCTVRTDLQETLRALFGERRAGVIPDFDRVVIETSGLADPAPALQTLVTDSMLAAQYRPDGVVTLVDAVHGARQLVEQEEARKQVALADLLLVTKDDLAAPGQVVALREDLRELNAQAEVRQVRLGEIGPQELVGFGPGSARVEAGNARFLGALLRDGGPGPDAPDSPGYLGGHRPGRLHAGIRTASLRFDRPFSWPVFAEAMQAILHLRGQDVLRVKGIVDIDGGPVVVQGVQHILHPPLRLDRWPGADRGSRLVWITRGMDAAAIRGMFLATQALGAAGPR